MKLIVGLGNPGGKYEGNRHNIGFMALDRVAADHGFSPWKSKFSGKIAEGTVSGEKLLLLKPETFMNRSGQSVGEAMRFYKLSPGDVMVMHDELDLAPGKARVKQGGGHAGHNGLRSIHAHIGADYGRVRLGIGHPGHKDQVARYVLNDFAKADADWLDDLLRGISDGIGELAKGDSGKFMNAVALRTAPPRSSGGQKSGETSAKAKPASEAKPTPPKPQPAPKEPEVQDEPQDNRSALQKLVDKFR
ncbi:MAG: aminoacyl-tRNA hydrolase [Rhodobacteraceae bacterium]|nr:aminoacyl-tRNA hydrolase [Paracoccaceae bacterium]